MTSPVPAVPVVPAGGGHPARPGQPWEPAPDPRTALQSPRQPGPTKEPPGTHTPRLSLSSPGPSPSGLLLTLPPAHSASGPC